MMDLKAMRGPANVNLLSLGGKNYMPNDEGIFYIPESHMIAAMAHGFKVVDEADLASQNVSELSARAVDQKVIFPGSATNTHEVGVEVPVENKEPAVEQFTGEAAAEVAADLSAEIVSRENEIAVEEISEKPKGKKGK